MDNDRFHGVSHFFGHYKLFVAAESTSLLFAMAYIWHADTVGIGTGRFGDCARLSGD